jgi:hypothetical protein
MDIEQRAEFGIGGLLGRADVPTARVVDQDVDAAVPGDDRLREINSDFLSAPGVPGSIP